MAYWVYKSMCPLVNVYSLRTGKSPSWSSVNQRTKWAMFKSYFDITKGWWFGNFFPYIGNNNPNWLFFRGVGIPPTRCYTLLCYAATPLAHWVRWKRVRWGRGSIAGTTYQRIEIPGWGISICKTPRCFLFPWKSERDILKKIEHKLLCLVYWVWFKRLPSINLALWLKHLEASETSNGSFKHPQGYWVAIS